MWVACDSMVCTEPTGVPIVMSLAVMPPVLFTLKVVILLSRSIASMTSTPSPMLCLIRITSSGSCASICTA